VVLLKIDQALFLFVQLTRQLVYVVLEFCNPGILNNPVVVVSCYERGGGEREEVKAYPVLS
jgi:hypothetical protein